MALARALGIAQRTARAWLALPDFPDVGAALGEADVATIRAWRRRRTSRGRRRLTAPGCPSPRRVGAETPNAPPTTTASEAEQQLVAANLDIKRLQLREREFDLGVREGRYVLRDDAERRSAQNLAAVRKALREIGRRLAPVAEGQPAVRIRQLFEVAVDEALRFWTQPRDDEHGADDGATNNNTSKEQES